MTPHPHVPMTYYSDVVDRRDAATMMRGLVGVLTWESHDTNRRECFFLRKAVPYYYGGKRGKEIRPLFTQIEPPYLRRLWRKVEVATNCSFEACFINYYENEKGNLGWHGDNSPSIDQTRPVCILSLGSPRILLFRPCINHDKVYPVITEPGSVIEMHAGIQTTWDHHMPPMLGTHGPRMSLVFRGLV